MYDYSYLLRIDKYFGPQLTTVRVCRVCWSNRLRSDSGQPIVGVSHPRINPFPEWSDFFFRFFTRYRGRSYIFTFRESGVEPLSIDSAYVGNETRFINHSRGKSVNCVARSESWIGYDIKIQSWISLPIVRIVNGELRLGIFASMFWNLCKRPKHWRA